MSEWQSIETAPKNGIVVKNWSGLPDDSPMLIHFDGEMWRHSNAGWRAIPDKYWTEYEEEDVYQHVE